MLYIIYGRKILHSYELYDSFNLAKMKHKSLPTPGKFVRKFPDNVRFDTIIHATKDDTE